MATDRRIAGPPVTVAAWVRPVASGGRVALGALIAVAVWTLGAAAPAWGAAGHPAPAAAAAPALAHPFGEPQTIRISATAERVAIRWQAPADDLRMLGGSLGALSDRQVVVVEPGGVPNPVGQSEVDLLRGSDRLADYLAAHIVVRQSGRGGAAVAGRTGRGGATGRNLRRRGGPAQLVRAARHGDPRGDRVGAAAGLRWPGGRDSVCARAPR